MENKLLKKVKQNFYYSETQGGLLRNKDHNIKHKKDKRAGFTRKDGYRYIRVDNKQYLEHKLVILLATGTLPLEVDHSDKNRTNNRLSNLTVVTRGENMLNKRRYKTSTTGITGVYKKGKRFTTAIQYKGKKEYLGTFSTIEDAAKARKQAEIKYGFHKNHGGNK